MEAPPLSLRAMVYSEGTECFAHCLDFDLVETGDTSDAAMNALAEAAGTQLAYARTNDNFAYLFHPAPREAWQRFGEILGLPHRTLVRVLADQDREFAIQSLLAA